MDNTLFSILNIISYSGMNDYIDWEISKNYNLKMIIQPKEGVDIIKWRGLGSAITSFLYNRKEKIYVIHK